MTRFLMILVLGLLICSNAFPKDSKLKCQSEDAEDQAYVTFNKKNDSDTVETGD